MTLKFSLSKLDTVYLVLIMDELNDNDRKIAAMVIGGLALLITVPFIWNNYQEYQQKESARKTCEEVRKIKDEVKAKVKRGERISPLEASGAFQLRYLTTCDCKEIKKTQDDMLARVHRGEQDALMEIGAVFQSTDLAACGKQNN